MTKPIRKPMVKSQSNVANRGVRIGVVTVALLLSACTENFTWQDSSTWHFKRSNDARKLYQMEQACLEAQPQDRRVLLMNGVSGAAVQTECMPYTKAPLQPKRFEGR